MPGRSSQLNPAHREDKISVVRRACLELLGQLQQMEQKHRLPGHQQTEDEPTEDSSIGSDGHLYRDVSLDELSQERESVRAWVQQVDDLLRASLAAQKDLKSSSASTDPDTSVRSSPDPAQFSEQLPSWAQPEASAEEPLRAFLQQGCMSLSLPN